MRSTLAGPPSYIVAAAAANVCCVIAVLLPCRDIHPFKAPGLEAIALEGNAASSEKGDDNMECPRLIPSGGLRSSLFRICIGGKTPGSLFSKLGHG